MKWKLARLMGDVGGWFGLVRTFLRVKLFLSTGTLKKTKVEHLILHT